MQLVVTGASGHGADSTASLKLFATSVAPYESLRGRPPLPDGFEPRQTTLSVLDGPDGKLLGRRVMYVK